MSEIKQGYKQTKVGIIPEDWEIVKLGKLTTVETGKTPLRSNKQFWDNGTINWATTTEVNETYIVSTNEKITNQAVAELKMKILPINTILLAMYGQGKTRGKVALLRIESTINQAFASIKPNKNYSTNFIFNYLDKSYEKIRDLSHGSNQDNLNLDIVKALQIPLPPLKEQEKIAEILTTWDEAITKQTELLEAKELQKKALMQKLLSGEVRFDGFSDKWKEVRIDKLFDFKKGQELSKEKLEKNGIFECILYGELYTTYSEVISEIKSKTNIKEGIKSKIDDILIPASTTTSAIDLAIASTIQKDNVLIGGDINILRKKTNNINGEFISKYLTHIKKMEIAKYAQGITIIHLYSKDFKHLKIQLPSLPEQQKIAEVLSLADDEINLLKNELEELKLQKKALMQKLLTGEVRVKV
ncbi:restriction endonuclease subunit S [Aliarcobacter trophiarum]|uniref:restriction endonuclease subunit S n=1 Tax=Aliarcobacter trophiarum TaxID=708186 RepID=UPI00100C2A6C|nr:restriction endonuclease subunit S [Aliarcobacter trophiarum]RXI25351.1 restriction endonuclease subunit S [Aliarcobacter trophiarum]